MSQSSLKRTFKPGTFRFILQSSLPNPWVHVSWKKQAATRHPSSPELIPSSPGELQLLADTKESRDKWHIKQELHWLGEGGMESDVIFPRNQFIMITRSQVLRVLFELQNLAYNYVLHQTVWRGWPEQTGTMQSKPSGPKPPPPPSAEQRGSLGWLSCAWGETRPSRMFRLCNICLAILIQARGLVREYGQVNAN